MKINKIRVHNFKAVENEELDFSGLSAIVTAKNNSGKTSVLRGMIDRFRGEKPQIIVKQGQEKGFNILELTDGSRIEWRFTEKSESFTYITKEGVKKTTGVIKSLSDKYFGTNFDIDKFLTLSAKEQEKKLFALLGIDLEDIDARYKAAYENRRDLNRDLKTIISEARERPEKVQKIDTAPLEAKIRSIEEHNSKVESLGAVYKEKVELLESIKAQLSGSVFEDFFDNASADQALSELKKGIPDRKDIDAVRTELEEAKMNNVRFENYQSNLKQYTDWVQRGKKARELAEEADKEVKGIEAERTKLLENTNLPDDFSFDESGLLFRGFPLSNNQLSSSAKYIAALKLARIGLGELQTLHFDASTLDNKSLSEVQDWATAEGLQLLIERPDYDGGEIKVEILESH